jgi:hypothetical protein
MARPRSPTTNCRRRCHRRRRRRRLRRAPPPSCCVVRSSAARLPLVVHPPPSRRVVRLQHASHHPIRPPSSSRRVVCRPPTARQHRHRLVAASSSSPLPLSSSRPLPALACRQREDIAATIVNTTSSSPTNEGVHHREESHGVCHSRGASSGARNVVGIAPPLTALPPRRHRRRSPRGRRGGVDGKAIFAKAIDLPCAGHHCPPGGREHHAATIPFPRCPVAPRPPRASPRPRRPCAAGKTPRWQ